MIDIKKIRNNEKETLELLKRKDKNIDLQQIIQLDKDKISKLIKVEKMKSEQNSISKKIPEMKKNNQIGRAHV